MELPKQDNYEQALRMAEADLVGADLEGRARLAGFEVVEQHGARYIEAGFLTEKYLIAFSSVEVLAMPDGPQPDIRKKVLILHYLRNASEKAPSGRWINFGEVPSGRFYLSAFKRRVCDQAVRLFAGDLRDFAQRAAALSAKPNELGDAAFVFNLFPKVPIMLSLVRADDEFPAGCTVLFDETIPSFLNTEDIAVAGGMLIAALKAAQ